MAVDIVEDILARIVQRLPDSAPVLSQLEAEVRQHWGGSDGGYVRKGIGTVRKTERLALALAQGKPLQQAVADAGLRRRAGFLHLSKSWSVKMR